MANGGLATKINNLILISNLVVNGQVLGKVYHIQTKKSTP